MPVSIFLNPLRRKKYFRIKGFMLNSNYSEIPMNNIQFASRRTDIRVVAVSGFLGFSAVAGWLLASFFLVNDLEPMQPIGNLDRVQFRVQFFEAIISVSLALLVWCSFLFVRPARYGRKWVIAEWIVVPLVWLLLVLAFDVWVHHLLFNSTYDPASPTNLSAIGATSL